MIRRIYRLLRAVVERAREEIQERVAKRWPQRAGAPAEAPAPVVVETKAAPVEAAPAVVETKPAPVVVEAAPAPVVEAAPAEQTFAEATPAPAAAPSEAPAAEAFPLRPLDSKEAIDGSVWLPRILWALEYANRRKLGPLSASDISRVLTQEAALAVPSTNVARAFRELKGDEQPGYWNEVGDRRYQISDAGREVLGKQLQATRES